MAHAETFNAVEGAHEGLASRALRRLHQVGKMVMSVFDLASPYYDGVMDRILQPGMAARRESADEALKTMKALER